jgi:hypothetical protein
MESAGRNNSMVFGDYTDVYYVQGDVEDSATVPFFTKVRLL